MKLIAITAGISVASGVRGLLTEKRMRGYALAGTAFAVAAASIGAAMFFARAGGNDNIVGAFVLCGYLVPAVAGFAIGGGVSKIRYY